MSYYFEVWLRGYSKNFIRNLANNPQSKVHITIARPFEPLYSEKKIIEKVIKICENQKPIYFELSEINYFDNKIVSYLSLQKDEELLKFNYSLEEAISNEVVFKKKLNGKKVLHATIETSDKKLNLEIKNNILIEQYMLRLTAIKNKKIWFSYDFVTQEVLDRKESLNKTKWYNTIHQFTKQTNLLPTRQGYKKIIK